MLTNLPIQDLNIEEVPLEAIIREVFGEENRSHS